MPNFWSLGCIVVTFYCCKEPDIHTRVQFSKVDYVADSFLWHLMSVSLWLPAFGAFHCLISIVP